VTLLGANGARLFRVDLGSPVRLLAAGTGPRQARVVAGLADGRVVTLSRAGDVVSTTEEQPRTVLAVALGLPGTIVQVGRTVSVGTSAVTLPPGGIALDYRSGTLVYRKGTQARARVVSSGADSLLQVSAVKAWQPLLFSTDTAGSAWAKGATVSWRAGPLS
jgi:hypothetical protein